MKKYFKMPLHYLATTTSFSNSHLGWDGGWNSKQGGSTVPIYAATDGVVIYAGVFGDAGNMIRIRYDSPDKKYSVFTQYKHMSRFSVKVGDNVSRGQQIGNMGNTGSASTGSHLHFDYVETPYQYNYTQNSSDRAKYSKNPLNHCFMFEDQVANSETLPTLTKILGTSKQVKRDTSKNQIEVIGDFLRCRNGAGTNQSVLGFIDYGLYDYTETKDANGYTWYKVPSGWIAGTKEDTKIYPKEEPKPTPAPVPEPTEDKDKIIAELEKEVEILTNTVKELKTLIDEQKDEIDKLVELNSNYANLKAFESPKEDYYYIKLKEKEKVYF